jgi:glycyl-tRNA synthetase beta chain
MPELLLELFSEEIPVRMQARAAADLERLVKEALAPLALDGTRTFHGPRRIVLVAELAASVPARSTRERGPRTAAPDAAVAGFLRKHGATRADLVQQDGYWVLERSEPPVPTAERIAAALPPLLRRFPWPKSMRWGSSSFTWVRPLRRIVCIFGGEVMPFALADGSDDGHGLVAGDLTEGHRFHAPGTFPVRSAKEWDAKLRERHVIVSAAERQARIAADIARLAAAEGLTVAADHAGLLEEVAGLVEWPVPLLGTIDASFMDLPPEVMQVSMRVNQRYFALTGPDGAFARKFAFVANIEATDGAAAIIAGNERVLRARLADARHFWDLDRRSRLESRLPKLEHVTFHARLGSQGARVRRIEDLAQAIARDMGAPAELAKRAARLAKADLVSGMVGEFPELQGVMGSYYALNDGEPETVAAAIREHYAPKGPDDEVPTAPVSVAVALAEKFDQICGFFAIAEKPTGSADPYGLRRAALGIVRIVRENALPLKLVPIVEQWRAFVLLEHAEERAVRPESEALEMLSEQVLQFIVERLRVALRAEGARHDVLAAVFAAGGDDDLNRLLARAAAVADLLNTVPGADLLAAYRRATNILRIEGKKDGPFHDPPEPALFREPEEEALAEGLASAQKKVEEMLAKEWFGLALRELARLRDPLDAFFERVTVNATEPELRRNRLRLLQGMQSTIGRIADLSKIEGRDEPRGENICA